MQPVEWIEHGEGSPYHLRHSRIRERYPSWNMPGAEVVRADGRYGQFSRGNHHVGAMFQLKSDDATMLPYDEVEVVAVFGPLAKSERPKVPCPVCLDLSYTDRCREHQWRRCGCGEMVLDGTPGGARHAEHCEFDAGRE